MTIELRIEKDDAGDLAKEAQELLEFLAGRPPEIRATQPDDGTHRGDPLAVAAIILAIPGAIMATLDLVERARFAKRVTRLKKKALQSPGDVTLRIDQRVVDLKTTHEDEIVNILIYR